MEGTKAKPFLQPRRRAPSCAMLVHRTGSTECCRVQKTLKDQTYRVLVLSKLWRAS